MSALAARSSDLADSAPGNFLHLAGGAHVIDLGRRLPEKQIGRDGRTKNRNKRGDGVTGELQVRDDAAGYDLTKIRMHEESGDHIGKQRDSQPFEDLEDDRVGHEDLERQDQNGGRHHKPQQVYGASSQQRTPGGDGAEVGSGVDGVGQEERGDARAHQRSRKLAAEGDAQADAGVKRDPGAELLDGRHQWERQQRGPQEPVAEVAPDL